MNKNSLPAYDEKTIKTLSSLEHIRLRPGMYIGRIGDGGNPDDGIYILLKEVSTTHRRIHHGVRQKNRTYIEEGIVAVRDFGRGIPLGKSSNAFRSSIPAPNITTTCSSSAWD